MRAIVAEQQSLGGHDPARWKRTSSDQAGHRNCPAVVGHQPAGFRKNFAAGDGKCWRWHQHCFLINQRRPFYLHSRGRGGPSASGPRVIKQPAPSHGLSESNLPIDPDGRFSLHLVQ
jgi:hypothetical protein